MFEDISKDDSSEKDSSHQLTEVKVLAQRKYSIKFESPKIQQLADQLYQILYAKHDASLVYSNNQNGVSECLIFDIWKVKIINGKNIKFFKRLKNDDDFQEVTFAKWDVPIQFKYLDCSEKHSVIIKSHILSNIFKAKVDSAVSSKRMFKNANGFWTAMDNCENEYLGTDNNLFSLLTVRNKKNSKYEHFIYKQFVKWIYKETKTSKEFLSAIFSMKGYEGGGYRSRLDLKEFMKYVRSRDGLMKVSREHRNLLPLLRIVPVRHWGKNNLFSVSGKSPVGFSLPLIKFCTKQPYCVVKEFAHKRIIFSQNSLFVDVIKRIYIPAEMQKINRRVLVCALLEIIDNRLDFIDEVGLSESRKKYILTLIGNILVKASFEESLQIMEIKDVFDWLFQPGVIERGLRKNDNWKLLKRRSEAWHTDLITQLDRGSLNDHPKPILEFQSFPFNELEIDGFVVRPISDSYKLDNHASLMKHCVGTYLTQCVNGLYRVVEVSRGDELATAGYVKKQDGEFQLDQVRGVRNTKMSPLFVDVAIKLLSMSHKFIKT